MKRYRMIAYYEDKDTAARVAQQVVVIERDVRAAVHAVKDALHTRAVGGHIIAIEVTERLDVETGVVFVGEPYIPIHWPTLNRPRKPHPGAETKVVPALPEFAEGARSSLPPAPRPTRAEGSTLAGNGIARL